MTKTLTEQWREGTLRGCFYWKLPNGNICMAYTDTMKDMKKVRDSNEVEVLQEAPSYYEWKRLQEQVKSANNAMKAMLPFAHNYPKERIEKYLEKWGVK